MPSQNSTRKSDSPHRSPRVYPLIVLSAATGAFFFIQYELKYTPPEVPSVILALALTLGAPLLMAYTRYSFLESVVVGMLPILGIRVGGWWNPPVSLLDLRNMLNATVLDVGLLLPVVTISYIVGVGLRGRDELSDRARPLAIRLGIAVLVFIIAYSLFQMNYLDVGMEQ